MTDLASLRRDYTLATLDETDADPFALFARWFEEAQRSEAGEVNAMTLATADASGAPSARTVLLKSFDDQGFVFYTNYESQKGRELTENPRASLVFFWQPIERQVVVMGEVERVSRDESEGYFRKRPRASQLGAWASAQSRPVASRAELDATFAEVEARFAAGDVPCPPHWGGFRVRPTRIEFWQGRGGRLHDRIRYTRGEPGWRVERICP